jgi:putative endonuclease
VRTAVQQLGDAAEDAAAARLAAAGWAVLGRQLRVGRAELDIVAIDPGPPRQLVVVEVRWRRGREFGVAEETVDARKRSRLHRAAFRWLDEHRPSLARLPLRFDLIVAEPGAEAGSPPLIRHHRAAF